jgi:hypothetical protein
MDFPPAPVNGGAALEIGGDVSVDPSEWLPPAAAERLRALRLRANDLHQAIPNFEKRQEAITAKTEAAQRLARLTGRRSELSGSGFGFELSPDDPRVGAEQKKLDSLTKAAELINSLYLQRSKDWTASSAVLAHTESWLKQGKPGGTMVVDHVREPLKLRNGQSLPDEIAKFRKKISELQAELARVENAPLPSSWCKQRAREQVEILVKRGRPDVRALVMLGRDIEFAQERHSHPLTAVLPKGTPVSGICGWEQADTLALFCWLHQTALVAAVDREIGSEADDAVALTPDQREKAAAKLRGELLDAERAECSLVWAALDQKLPVEFRAETDCCALLAAELVTPPVTAAATGSVGDHVFDLVGI